MVKSTIDLMNLIWVIPAKGIHGSKASSCLAFTPPFAGGVFSWRKSMSLRRFQCWPVTQVWCSRILMINYLRRVCVMKSRLEHARYCDDCRIGSYCIAYAGLADCIADWLTDSGSGEHLFRVPAHHLTGRSRWGVATDGSSVPNCLSSYRFPSVCRCDGTSHSPDY